MEVEESRSAGPGGKQGTSNPGKTNVSLSYFAANRKDPPPGSSDWVAVKNSGTSSASGKGGGSKWTARPSGRGPKGMIRDSEDFLALVPLDCSSTNLLDYEDAEALIVWQNYISEISIKEIAILGIVLFEFSSLFKTFNGSKDSKSRINIFSSIIDSADAPVLVRAVRAAHTEWKKHELGRGEAVEPIIVIVDSAVHGDPLGVPGGIDDSGQVGRVEELICSLSVSLGVPEVQMSTTLTMLTMTTSHPETP